MATRKPRLGESIRDFDVDIAATNAYINEPCPPPVGNTNGKRLGWTTEEIAYWNDADARWHPLMGMYGNKSSERTTNVIDQLKGIIKDTRTYERTHRLYDRIAVSPNAVNVDYEVFHIKRSTPLADLTHKRVAEPGMKTVLIDIKKLGHLTHQLLVTSPDREGRGKEDGVKEILIYKAIASPLLIAPALDHFQYVGDVSRGFIKVNHEDGTQGQKAWYIGRVKNSRGEIGIPSEPVGFIII